MLRTEPSPRPGGGAIHGDVVRWPQQSPSSARGTAEEPSPVLTSYSDDESSSAGMWLEAQERSCEVPAELVKLLEKADRVLAGIEEQMGQGRMPSGVVSPEVAPWRAHGGEDITAVAQTGSGTSKTCLDAQPARSWC